MKTIAENIENILQIAGEDITREGLRETPKRYEAFLTDFLSPPEFNPTVFDSEGYDEMVVQVGIPFYSLCEHHLLPFYGEAAVCYIPNKHIIGLSKLARTVEYFSRRLQNQERITHQVADYLEKTLSPKGVGVILSARHFCMEMRGVRRTNVSTKTSSLRGVCKTKQQTRSEFIALVSQGSV